jgi:peptidoglycan/LPS O-acetylase OafA/YrhL
VTRTDDLWRALRLLFSALLVLLVAHDVDHLVNEERLTELTTAFWVFLPFQYGAFVAVLAFVWRRRPQAASLAAVLAATTVIGFVVAHVLPFGLAPYGDEDPLALSWALVFVPMAVAAAAFAVAMQLRGASRPAAPADIARA